MTDSDYTGRELRPDDLIRYARENRPEGFWEYEESGPDALDGLEAMIGDGFCDEIAGPEYATENGARVENWIVWTDSMGGRDAEEYETTAEAEAALAAAYREGIEE
jgi:hypothetical protein